MTDRPEPERHPDPRLAEIIETLRSTLRRLDALGLSTAAAHLSMAIDCLEGDQT
jgi:hypothetical protein